MSLSDKLARIVMGNDPQMRRILGYWAGTAAFYLLSISMMWLMVLSGGAERGATIMLSWCIGAAVVVGYASVRASPALRILPWQLAGLQALSAIVCIVIGYAVSGPIRGAALMSLLVVIVFCAFALRPRQTLVLCAVAICALGGTIGWLVAHDPARFPPSVEAAHFGLATASLLVVALLTGEMNKLRTRLKRQKEELLAAVATIQQLATVDELTSLANRRHMNEVLGAEERRHRSSEQPLCIALLDIDFFKSINDRFGHAVGDEVLRAFAGAARAELRSGDVLARWGGEEFLLMLPETGLSEATGVLSRMAERVGAMCIADLDIELGITFSAGLVERQGAERFADTISRADRAMYIAKSSGRNQVVRMGA